MGGKYLMCGLVSIFILCLCVSVSLNHVTVYVCREIDFNTRVCYHMKETKECVRSRLPMLRNIYDTIK